MAETSSTVAKARITAAIRKRQLRAARLHAIAAAGGMMKGG